jgi:hypothetical protein
MSLEVVVSIKEVVEVKNSYLYRPSLENINGQTNVTVNPTML